MDNNEKTEEDLERKTQEFKEKLQYWRETGTPISIPDNFRAR
jgi:hypothetical protein